MCCLRQNYSVHYSSMVLLLHSMRVTVRRNRKILLFYGGGGGGGVVGDKIYCSFPSIVFCLSKRDLFGRNKRSNLCSLD